MQNWEKQIPECTFPRLIVEQSKNKDTKNMVSGLKQGY